MAQAFLQVWGGDTFIETLSGVNRGVLEHCVLSYLSQWTEMPSSVKDVLPEPLVEAGDRIGRLFKAVGFMLDLPDCSKGIADCQYFRNYKGPLVLEKTVRAIFCESKSFWDSTYHEVIRTAASSKLAAPKFEELKKVFLTSEVDMTMVLDVLPDILQKFVDIKAGMRKGPLKELETKIHHTLVKASNDLIGEKLPVPTVSIMESLLSAFRGPLSQQSGALDLVSSLQKFMNTKSKEMSLAELKNVLQTGASAKVLEDLDFAKFQKLLRHSQGRSGTMVMEEDENIGLVNHFLHNVTTLLYRKVGRFHFTLR